MSMQNLAAVPRGREAQHGTRRVAAEGAGRVDTRRGLWFAGFTTSKAVSAPLFQNYARSCPAFAGFSCFWQCALPAARPSAYFCRVDSL